MLDRCRSARTQIDSFGRRELVFGIAVTSSPTLGGVSACDESLPIESSCRDTSCVRSHVSSPSPLTSTPRVAGRERYEFAPVARSGPNRICRSPQFRLRVAPKRPIDLIGSALFVFGSCANELHLTEQIGVHLHR
jgi:hypothetical protein